PFGHELIDRLADGGRLVQALVGAGRGNTGDVVGVRSVVARRNAVVVVRGVGDQWAVADLHRIGAPRYLDHWRRTGLAVRARLGEVVGEAFGVDSRGGDDDLEIRTARQQVGEVAED